MKIDTEKSIILVLIIAVGILSLILLQSQKTIEGQRNTIAVQQAQISELETEIAKLSQLTPERIINDAKSILKSEGINFLNTFNERLLQQ